MRVPLAGPHLDAAVAEQVFGYKVEGGKAITEILRLPSPLAEVERIPNRQEIPPYSTDLNYGWQVARRIRDDSEAGLLSSEAWNQFERAIIDSNFWKTTNVEASEFICRAALEAVRHRKDKPG